MKTCEIPGCTNQTKSKRANRCIEHIDFSLGDYYRLKIYENLIKQQENIENVRIERIEHKTGCPYDLVFDVKNVEKNVLLSWCHGNHKPDPEVLKRKRVDAKLIIENIKKEINLNFGSHCPSDIVGLYVDIKFLDMKRARVLSDTRRSEIIKELESLLYRQFKDIVFAPSELNLAEKKNVSRAAMEFRFRNWNQELLKNWLDYMQSFGFYQS